MHFLKWFLSGEVLFAGFLTGYLLTPLTNGVIVFSHIFMILSILAFLNRIYKRKVTMQGKIIPTTLFLLILFLIYLSLLYTPNLNFGKEKALLFTALTGWTFFGTLFLIGNKKGLKRLFQGMIFYCSITSFFMTLTLFQGNDYGVGIGGAENVIGVARFSGLGIILVIGLYFYPKINKGKKIFFLITLFVLLFSLLGAGSRGPLIATVLSLLIFVPMSFKFSLKNLTITYNKGIASLFALFALIAVAIPPLVNIGYFDTLIDRINVLLKTESGGGSVVGRFNRFDTAYSMFIDSPMFGKGIGSFSYYYWGLDTSGYAHNIFLEFLSELGLIGLISFLALLLYGIFNFVKYNKNKKIDIYQVVIFIGTVYLLINACVSSDINGNRLLFAFIALLIMSPYYRMEKTYKTIR